MKKLLDFAKSLEGYLEYDEILKDVSKHVLKAAEKAAEDSQNTKVDDQVVAAIKLLLDRFWE